MTPSYRLLSLIVLLLYAAIHSCNPVFAASTSHNIIRLLELPQDLRPHHCDQHGNTRRVIFIGDVHGAYDELVSLLVKVNYRSSTGASFANLSDEDHVVFLGDLVAKGPHSAKVVELASEMNASCVLGNHDYDLLDYMGYIKSPEGTDVGMSDSADLPEEIVLNTDKRVEGENLSDKSAKYLLQCPLILRVGEIDGEELIAVHAGLLSHKSLEEQGRNRHYTN